MVVWVVPHQGTKPPWWETDEAGTGLLAHTYDASRHGMTGMWAWSRGWQRLVHESTTATRLPSGAWSFPREGDVLLIEETHWTGAAAGGHVSCTDEYVTQFRYTRRGDRIVGPDGWLPADPARWPEFQYGCWQSAPEHAPRVRAHAWGELARAAALRSARARAERQDAMDGVPVPIRIPTGAEEIEEEALDALEAASKSTGAAVGRSVGVPAPNLRASL